MLYLVPFCSTIDFACVLLCSDFLSISNMLLSLLSQAAVARVPLLLKKCSAAVILDCVADFVFAGKSFAFSMACFVSEIVQIPNCCSCVLQIWFGRF